MGIIGTSRQVNKVLVAPSENTRAPAKDMSLLLDSSPSLYQAQVNQIFTEPGGKEWVSSGIGGHQNRCSYLRESEGRQHRTANIWNGLERRREGMQTHNIAESHANVGTKCQQSYGHENGKK